MNRMDTELAKQSRKEMFNMGLPTSPTAFDNGTPAASSKGMQNNIAELNKMLGEVVHVYSVSRRQQYTATLLDGQSMDMELFRLQVTEGYVVTFHPRTLRAACNQSKAIIFDL